MQAEQLRWVVPTFLLLLAAGMIGVQVQSKLERASNDTTVIAQAQDTPPPPSEAPLQHLVRSRFKPGPADNELTLIFDVTPALETMPNVRWRPSGTNEAQALTVQRDSSGRYSVVLSNVPPTADAQVVIELPAAANTPFELHGAEFTLLPHVSNGPASRPSRDGHFVVFTQPQEGAQELRLLVGSSEQPLENLPAGVSSKGVAKVYSIDFLSASDHADGWFFTMATGTDKKSRIFHFPKDGKEWKAINSFAMPDRSLIQAAFAGPGTYLLVREVSR